MITKLAIAFLILHVIYIGVSNSLLIQQNRFLQKSYPSKAIAESKQLLREGDMIFRLNKDGYSQYIKNFNRNDKQYSHAGIVIIEKESPVIYHMVSENENSIERMAKYTFEEFTDPKKNYAFGIYRNDMSEKEKEIMITQIKNWYNEGIEFDFLFNLESDDKMYCSEMIAKAIKKATNNRIKIGSTKLTTKEAIAFAAYLKQPLDYTKDLKVVAVDNLYKHKWCSVVKEYEFKR